MQVDATDEKITLRQTTYLIKLLERFDMAKCKPVRTPMESGVSNSLEKHEDQADQKTIKWYQQLIGSLI